MGFPGDSDIKESACNTGVWAHLLGRKNLEGRALQPISIHLESIPWAEESWGLIMLCANRTTTGDLVCTHASYFKMAPSEPRQSRSVTILYFEINSGSLLVISLHGSASGINNIACL